MSVRVVVFRVLIQVYTDSYCLSILTIAVMISGIVINTVNQIPPLAVALQQINPGPMKSSWSLCRQQCCHGHEFCLTTKWFTKLNTMKVKTWIIIGPNNYTWHPSKLLVSEGHSFMRTRDVRQQDQENTKVWRPGLLFSFMNERIETQVDFFVKSIHRMTSWGFTVRCSSSEFPDS